MLRSVVSKSTEMTAFQFKQSVVLKFWWVSLETKIVSFWLMQVTSLAECQNRSIQLSTIARSKRKLCRVLAKISRKKRHSHCCVAFILVTRYSVIPNSSWQVFSKGRYACPWGQHHPLHARTLNVRAWQCKTRQHLKVQLRWAWRGRSGEREEGGGGDVSLTITPVTGAQFLMATISKASLCTASQLSVLCCNQRILPYKFWLYLQTW